MNTTQAGQLVDISVFDTARNVYFTLKLSSELGVEPEELVSSIHQIRQVQTSKNLAESLFKALLACSSLDEQILFIERFFNNLKDMHDPYLSIEKALCTLNTK